MTNAMIHIPKGSSPEDIKARKQLIGDFYAKWCAEHPDKQIWNSSLNASIHVKFHSINETKGHASGSFESTKAIFNLTSILENAKKIKQKPKKQSEKESNQKQKKL